ncbi:MAG TPA: cytochrome P450 [Myxococcaceae bacterium]|nr:cytochrome P450 [Myxococcaceae bacterium]
MANGDPLSHIPGSDSLLELPRMLSDPPRFLEERYARHGPLFRTRWVVPLVFAIGPEANKTIHVTQRTSFSYQQGYRDTAMKRIFAGSLLMEDGASHQHDRDILQPAMGRLALQDTFAAVAQIWERTAQSLSDGAAFDAYELVRRATFEVSANALIHLGLEDLAAFQPLFERLIDGAMGSVDWRIPFGRVDRGLRARDELIQRLVPLVDRARDREPEGMLGLLAHHREPDGTPLSSQRIAEHLLLLFWAGYDTTASTGSWLLHELSGAPEWQDRLAVEHRAQLNGDQPTLEALEKLTEHGWTLKEVERLRPAVLFFQRRNVGALELLGRQLPADTMIFYSGYLTHRMEELFSDPERFQPERWDPARGKATAPATALVGFGGGPRICLGKAFAVMQLRVMLAALLRRFRIERAPQARPRVVPLPIYRMKGARLVVRRR